MAGGKAGGAKGGAVAEAAVVMCIVVNKELDHCTIICVPLGRTCLGAV